MYAYTDWMKRNATRKTKPCLKKGGAINLGGKDMYLAGGGGGTDRTNKENNQ